MMKWFKHSLYAALCAVAGSSAGLAQADDLTGAWQSNWGSVTLTASEGGYVGTYSTDGGQVSLTYSVDGSYQGEWAENDSARKCETWGFLKSNYHWGSVSFEVNADGTELTGSWAYCDDTKKAGTWTLKRSPDPLADPVSFGPRAHPLIGNWYVDQKDLGRPRGMISIYQSYEWDCTNPNDSWCYKRIVDGGELEVAAGVTEGPYNTIPREGRLAAKGAGLEVRFNLGSGAVSTIYATGDNQATGKWKTRFEEGWETWTRAIPKVHYTAIMHREPGGPPKLSGRPLGQPITLVTDYRDEKAYFRGNRSKVYLNLIGENLWGEHDFYLARSTGIEITSRDYICKDGTIRAVWRKFRGCHGHGGVIGRQLELVVWWEATSGLKTLWFNGQQVPFNLKVEGHPEDTSPEILNPQLSQVILLDDQVEQRAKPGDRLKDYRYPFDHKGDPTNGENSRLLAVVGKNLRQDGATFVVSKSRHVDYQPLVLPQHIQTAFEKAAKSLGKPIKPDEQIIPVRAHLKPGVTAGVKFMQISGLKGTWPLLFTDQFGSLNFYRDGEEPGSRPETVFYDGETLRIAAIAHGDGLPLNGLPVTLEAQKVDKLGKKVGPPRKVSDAYLDALERTREHPNAAISIPFKVRHHYLGQRAKVDEEDPTPILWLAPDERLVARPTDKLTFTATPPVRSATILGAPATSSLWKDALKKVAACQGIGGDPTDPAFVTQTSTVFENWIMTEAIANRWTEGTLTPTRGATRQIRVTKGDHAALLLIRDALLPLVLQQNVKLLPYMGQGEQGETKAMRYYTLAQQNTSARGNAFWRQEVSYRDRSVSTQAGSGSGLRRVVRDKGTVKKPLGDMLDFKAHQAFLRSLQDKGDDPADYDVQGTRNDINQRVAKAITDQYNATEAAIGLGYGAENCKVADLLMVAGQGAEPAVRKLFPDLVHLIDGIWSPDKTARRYVSSVPLLGQAIRAQKDYAALDNAYKAMGIALVAAPVAYGSAALVSAGGTYGTAAGYTLAALATGADLFDMAYFGSKDFEDYLEGERNYYTAIGLAPVLGEDIVREAEGRRSTAALASLGVLAPSLGTLGNLSAIRDIKRIADGRELVRSGRLVEGLDGLDEPSSLNLAAYYDDLSRRKNSFTSRLSPEEEGDLKALENLVSSKLPDPQFEALDDISFLDLDFAAPPSGGIDNAFAKMGFGPFDKSSRARDSFNPLVSGPRGPPGDDFVIDLGDSAPITLSDANRAQRFPLGENYRTSQDLWKNAPEQRYDHIYRVEDLPIGRGVDGTLGSENIGLEVTDRLGNKSIRPFPKADTKIQLEDGTTLDLGQPLGAGGFKQVYSDAANPTENVYKAISSDWLYKRHKMTLEDIEDYIHDEKIGRQLLTRVAEGKGKGLMEVVPQTGPTRIIDDPTDPRNKLIIQQEKNIAQRVEHEDASGQPTTSIVTNARERILLRPEKALNDLEELTVQLTMRRINDEGIVWPDNKMGNFDVVEDTSGQSPTGYKMVFFDLDTFRVAPGNTPLERARNARTAQRAYDSSFPLKQVVDKKLPNIVGPEQVMKMHGVSGFDDTIFGKKMYPLHTYGANQWRTEYQRLSNMSDAELQEHIQEINATHKLNVRYEAPAPSIPPPGAGG